MIKKTIAVDIDDVLSKTAKGFTHFSNQTWGSNLTELDFSEDLQTMWGVDETTAIERLHTFFESDLALTYERDEDSEACLRLLAGRFTLIAVTSRNSMIKEKTSTWLDKHYPNVFEAVYHAGIYDNLGEGLAIHVTKADTYKRLEADIVIDDHLKHCIGAAELGIKAILFGDYPWNQADTLPEGIVRCANWPAVVEYLS